MNELKLKQLVDETVTHLNLNQGQQKYLDTVVNLAYLLGSRNGLEEGMKITHKVLSPEKKV